MHNWEHRFKGMSRRHNVDFGTVLGKHTVAELKDLVDAKDYTLKQIESLFKQAPVNDKRLGDWITDWGKLRSRYNAARLKANDAITGFHILPDSASPAEDEYNAIIMALQPAYPSESKGDLQDLYRRIVDMGLKPDLSETPQPKAIDPDLNVVKASDVMTGVLGGALQGAQSAVHQFVPQTDYKKLALYVGGAVVLGLFVVPKILSLTPAGILLKRI